MTGVGDSSTSDKPTAVRQAQHEEPAAADRSTTMSATASSAGGVYSCCREPCTICGKQPLRYRGLANSMTLRDAEELWDYFDAGYLELLGGAPGRRQHEQHDNEPRVDRQAAGVAANKAQKHLRKLQIDLAEMGIIEQADQRYTGKSEKARLIAPFRKGEIVFGRKLGTGGFSCVYEVKAFRPDMELSEELHPFEEAARDFLVKHVRRKAPPEGSADASPEEIAFYKRRKRYYLPSSTSYAVKHLKYSLVEDSDKYGKAAVDIALEAQLLLVLDHPHIISLRGWARHGTDAFRGGSPSDFFLVLDCLPEILDESIYIWRHSLLKYKARGKLPWLRKKFSLKIKKLFIERVKVAHDVASAVEYMHDRRIINRDLKTSNIGFDSHGEVKLFDLGLSRLMPKGKYKLQDGYVMSRVGTKATMAPEVRRKQPYDLSADVYSFGIVLWEILTLSTSTEYFQRLKREELRRLEDGVDEARPDEDDEYLLLPICPCWPKALQGLLRKCLMYDPKARPSMANVRRILHYQMEALGVSMIGKRRRRSTFRLDLSKMDIDDFSRTSIDSSLREPISSTEFRPMQGVSPYHAASSTGADSGGTENPADDDAAGVTSQIAVPMLLVLPDRMVIDTDSSESRSQSMLP